MTAGGSGCNVCWGVNYDSSCVLLCNMLWCRKIGCSKCSVVVVQLLACDVVFVAAERSDRQQESAVYCECSVLYAANFCSMLQCLVHVEALRPWQGSGCRLFYGLCSRWLCWVSLGKAVTE